MADEKNGLFGKLVQAMGEIGHIQKTGKNKEQNYSYATDEEIMRAVQRAFFKVGIAFLSSCEGIEKEPLYSTRSGNTMYLYTVKMKYTLADPDTGYTWDLSGVGQGTDTGDKGVYKAITGATKYALLKTLLLPTGDDPEKDDPNAKENERATAAPPKATPKNSTQKTAASGSADKKPTAKERRDNFIKDICSKYKDWADGDEIKAKAGIRSIIGAKVPKEWTPDDIKELQIDIRMKTAPHTEEGFKLLDTPDPPEDEFKGIGEDPPATDIQMATEKQQKYIHTLGTKLSMDNDELLDLYFFKTEHEVDGSHSLTKNEANKVIDYLVRQCGEKGIKLESRSGS